VGVAWRGVGMVRCAVEYGSGDYSYVDSEPFHVLSAPRVSVDPIAVGAYIRQTLDIKCRLRSDSDSTSHTNISWLRDGQELTEQDRGSLSDSLLLNTAEQLVTSKTAKIMNGDITSAALCHCQRASKVISPFIIFAVFDV